jgi:lipopolysaccharide/colanic/teichoic acid biosynthesis glycosyltransferase
MAVNEARTLLVGGGAREISGLRRLVDVAVVLLVSPLIAPLLLVLALLVKLDSRGPAFYSQKRIGAGGRPFRMWKLRTMVADAESRKEELLALNALTWPDFKLEQDPRVTRVGRLLRATTLDELPQLLHVLRGEMTLVGPRAWSLDVASYKLWQTERLEYRPGLFGSWQAGARGVATVDDRCRMDIRDRRSESLGRDIGLTARSLLAVLRRTGRH